MTDGLREYTEVLQDGRTPDPLGELGWAVGDTFYVALLHEDVLAVTTVGRAVWHLEDKTIQLDRASNRWVGIKTFGIGEGFNDRTFIKNTLDQPAYADDYLGLPPEEQQGDAHGPYSLAAIDFADFSHVSAHEARTLLRKWADQALIPSDAVRSDLESNVYALLDAAADSVYGFPQLGQEAAHKRGGAVGLTGFQEFMTIDRTQHRLSVIVASDG